MHIDLTKKQFENLLQLVYLGDWIAQAPREEPENGLAAMEQYLLSLAKEFGLKSYAGFDKEAGIYYPTEEFEKRTGVVQMLDQYNEYTVWETLMLGLARRDLVHELGEDKVEAMSEEELNEKEYPLIQKYEEEFSKHGLDNLMVKQKR
jgi:hypothetical protein